MQASNESGNLAAAWAVAAGAEHLEPPIMSNPDPRISEREQMMGEAVGSLTQTATNTAFEGGTVGVDPDVLVETAEAAFRQISDYRNGLETVTKLIDSSESIWVGEAGDAFRQVFKLELSKIEETLDEYAAYPGDLLEFAGLYSDSIAKAETFASSISEFKMI